jgi:nucleoside-diphosphate-sugar epimerase
MSRNAKILITGAAGRIGRALLPELINTDYHLRLVEHSSPINAKNVEIVKGSITDPQFVRKALEDIDIIIHLATVKENRDKFIDVSLRGTFELLDQAQIRGKIKQFIHAGADCTYGIFYYPQSYPNRINECHPYTAYPGYYALSKVLEEVMCQQYSIQYGLPVTILKFSWVLRDDDILNHMTLHGQGFGVPDWKKLAVSQEQKRYFEKNLNAVVKLIHHNGKPGIRHIVAIKDVIKAIILALGNKAAIGQSFNIAAKDPFNYHDVANYIAKKLD